MWPAYSSCTTKCSCWPFQISASSSLSIAKLGLLGRTIVEDANFPVYSGHRTWAEDAPTNNAQVKPWESNVISQVILWTKTVVGISGWDKYCLHNSPELVIVLVLLPLLFSCCLPTVLSLHGSQDILYTVSTLYVRMTCLAELYPRVMRGILGFLSRVRVDSLLSRNAISSR